MASNALNPWRFPVLTTIAQRQRDPAPDVSPRIMHDYQCLNDIYGVTEPFQCSAICRRVTYFTNGDHTMQTGQVLDRLLRKICPDMHKLRRTALFVNVMAALRSGAHGHASGARSQQ
jgi:hypothetical protein